jgi:hypothetical protein
LLRDRSDEDGARHRVGDDRFAVIEKTGDAAGVVQTNPSRRARPTARDRRPFPNKPLSLKVKYVLVFD